MEIKDIQKWVDTFYQGSNVNGRVEIRAFNDKYTLCYIKGHTGYTTRMGGNVYSPSEWFVVETLSKCEHNTFGTRPNILFRFEGRLTKEIKQKLKADFDLEVEQTKKEKIIVEPDTFIIGLERDSFWGGMFIGQLICYRLIKEEDGAYITFSKSQNKYVRINKNKYLTFKVKEIEKDVKLAEMKQLFKDYSTKLSEANEIKSNIISNFDK